MLDFMMIATHTDRKRGIVEVFPKFIMKSSQDLMIRGGDFYAIWDEDRGLWSTDEQDAVRLIDRAIKAKLDEVSTNPEFEYIPQYMWDSTTGTIDKWHRYCQKQMWDSYYDLDETLIFANHAVDKKDYASKRLPYALEPGEITAWNKLISTLYNEEERHKIEWAIGAIVSGDSKTIQKFMVMYGAAGTGKSTIINVIEKLFEGYCSVFDAKALGSANSAFALEPFRANPLVAIQHDGDLSRIEDNTRLNSLVSHEYMTMNEKFKATYPMRFNAFLIMGTNRPVKITDAKSGLIRRLIDVTPSGRKLPPKEYKQVTKQVGFELGAIATHCLNVYKSDPGYYDDYIPISMLSASNDFYNFVIDSYAVFMEEDGVTLKAAWEMYKTYCEDAKVPYPFSRKSFQEELKNYFWNFDERYNLEDGTRVRSYYHGFRTDIFDMNLEIDEPDKVVVEPDKIKFEAIESIFDREYADCLAQYATLNETPSRAWENVRTKLHKIDTSKLHYVKVPENHIVIDFDIKDKDGNKCFERNLEEASKWPPTYAELSKSGGGIHLHYIYAGDASKLSRVYDESVEIKVFTGNSSLRRKLTKCNKLPIATISSGLPLKGEKKMVDFDSIQSEKGLRTLIKKNLNKEIHPGTKPSIDFIYKILTDAYESGMKYDVSDMFDAVFSFGANSTHQSDYCIKLIGKMPFKSDETAAPVSNNDAELVFYDVEVFPNLLLVNWKVRGEGKPVVRMINPKPTEIEELLKFNLVGFYNRDYDNHILYARLMGYTNEQIYNLSQRITNKDKQISRQAKFGEAYNLSYTDVYDFSSKKQSLKKWEIELGIHHQELGLPWDKPVPKELWPKVAEYCDNDVIATEAVFDHLKGDWTARQILADLADGSYNDTTNTLTGKIIFGNNRKPHGEFQWRDLSQPVMKLDPEVKDFLTETFPKMMAHRHGPAKSLLPYFEGYKFEFGKSIYKGVEVGEGGRVDAKPGIWGNVALLDITSMHPHSAMAECLFGPRFTRRFKEIVYGRVHIKHEAWEEVNKMLDGKLKPYIQKVLDGEMTSGELADALKIAINSVYGLTAAKFDTLFKDPRNKDNIVAKRGALFMVDLKEEVEKRGFIVCHTKTDSIKIPDATLDIIQFVMEFGERYGYAFEHEATYDRMCLVNDAVYIAKYKDVEWCEKRYGYIPSKQKKNAGKWSATGTQFAVPYVFKTLFSKEPIEFEDLCETKTVQQGALYLDTNEGFPDVSVYEAVMALRTGGKRWDKLTKKEKALLDEYSDIDDKTLDDLINQGHDYHFIGRVGNFCPIKPGCNGGTLYRYADNKYFAATGTKGYRWLESEMVKTLGKEDDIDLSYYRNLVDGAVDAISQYGDFERFVAEEPWPEQEFYFDWKGVIEDPHDDVPPWEG